MDEREPDPRAALHHYPLDAPTVEQRDSVGIINDNWYVADGGQRYVLRAYKRVLDPGRVAFQLAFQEHLGTCGFPTAPVVRTKDRELFACLDGQPWALFGFVEGEEFNYARPAQAREAGSRLAEFERVAERYDGAVVAPPVGEVDFERWLAPVSTHVWRTPVLSAEHERQLFELYDGEGCDDELRFFREWRQAATRTWPRERITALPESWVHCDYHGRNMVFQGDTLAGLFDFDFLVRGPRVFDVGRALFNFGRERRGSRTLRPAFCRAFLEGFVTGGPLTDEETRSLPFMAVLNWVPDAAFYVARRPEAGDPGIVRRFRWDIEMMRAMQAEMQRLAPEFGWPA